MSRYLPKSKGHRTLAAKRMRAMANDMRRVVDMLNHAAAQYDRDEIEPACETAYMGISFGRHMLEHLMSDMTSHKDVQGVLRRGGFYAKNMEDKT